MTAPMLLALAAAVGAFACAVLATALLLRSRWARRALDRPNERSLHASPIPRTGGLGILAGLATGAAIGAQALDGPSGIALAGAALLGAVSWADDVRGLPAALRLAVHLAVAGAWSWSTGLPAPWIAPAVVALAWSTNLYNFMDGADGLAGGMAVTGFGALAWALAAAGQPGPACVAASAAAASAGFLCFNYPPARVFMGDSGSIPLGFLAGALSLHGWRTGAWSPCFPLIVFLPFWFDASLTLALRTLRGARPWQAHREHVYQLAVTGGLGHRGLVRRAHPAMLACALAGLVSREASPGVQALILAGLAGVALAIALRVHLRHGRPRPL